MLGGAKIQAIDPTTRQPVSLPGLNAAIDDDVSSGWTPPTGKTVLVVSLSQPSSLDSLRLFAPGAQGTYSVKLLSDPAATAGRTILEGDIASGTAGSGEGAVEGQYLLIELDLTSSAPLRSIDAIGRPKPGADNFISVVSPASGEQNSGSNSDGQLVEVNFAAKALGAKVAEGADAQLDAIIDGDTATNGQIVIAASGGEKPLIDLAAAVEVERVSLSFGQASGKVTFIATDGDNPTGRVLGSANLDGTSKTLTLETPGISAQSISILWEPSDGQPLVVGEVGVFAMARVRRERADEGGGSGFRIDTPNGTPPPPPAPTPPPPAPPGPRNDPKPPVILPPAKPVSE